MNKLAQIIAALLLALLLLNTAHGQENSNSKPENSSIIACRFEYIQFVKFNVIGKGNKEITDLINKDFLIYENNQLQEIQYFRVMEDNV